MGKGNRARLDRAQDKLDQPKTYTAEKKQKRNWANVAIVLFISVVLVLSLALSTLQNSGALMRSSAAVNSDNYTVSGTMISYFFNSQYSAFIQNYGSIAGYLGLDTSKPLKDQACSMIENGTWYDYFMQSAVAYVSELLTCCEYAEANGLALDAEDEAEIDEALEVLNETAFNAGYSLNGYISAVYGSGVKVKDIRSAMELILLANKGAMDANDKFEAELTEDVINAYYEEHPESFLKANYMVHEYEATMDTVDEDDYADTAAYEAALNTAKDLYEKDKDAAREKARAYEELKDVQAFIDKLTADLTAEYDGYYDGSADLTEAERDAKEKEQVAKDLEAASIDGYAYQNPEDENADALAQWLFAADRKVGDITVIEDEDEELGTFTAYVYCATATVSRDEYTTANIAYAMFPASEGASATVAASLKQTLAGVTTAEAFEEIMKDQSSSGHSVIENMTEGSFGFEEVDAYVFAEGRQAGDCEVINCGTEYIATILYLGEGDVAWYAQAKNGALNEKMTAWYEEIGTTYAVSTNEKALNKVIR